MPKAQRKTQTLVLCDAPRSGNATTEKILVSKKIEVEYPEGSYIHMGNLKSYLLMNASVKSTFLPLFTEKYLQREPKIGIKRVMHMHPEDEGNLYHLDFMRLKSPYKLLVDMEDLDLPAQGVLKLGGENRPFFYERSHAELLEYSQEEKARVIAAIARKDIFKLYCVTPAIWNTSAGEMGWRADWMIGKATIGRQTQARPLDVMRQLVVGIWEEVQSRDLKQCIVQFRRVQSIIYD